MEENMDTNPAYKPGVKSTEFYVWLVVFGLNGLIMADVLAEGEWPYKVACLILSTLAAAGYQWRREKYKGQSGALAESIRNWLRKKKEEK
jgi:hypothetical protein